MNHHPFYTNRLNVKLVVLFSMILMGNTIFSSCTEKMPNSVSKPQAPLAFDATTLKSQPEHDVKKVRGQLLYMPIYSNVPYYKPNETYNLSGFVAIHNTDLNHPIKLTKVLFFNNDGQLMADYLKADTLIHALGAGNYFIPESDQSGTGANFLIEWMADTLVNEPLIETVMLGTGHQGISFLSQGKIIRELK